MKWVQGLSILVAFLGFSAGLKMSLKSFDGKTTARLYEQGRVVAGTRQPVKKTLLLNENIVQEENIILSTTVTRDENLGIIGLKFGNFITEYGQSLCSAFSKVEVILFGDSIAVSGEAPRIIFTGDCPSRRTTNSRSTALQLETIFPMFLISDCQQNTKVADQYQLSNGTNVKLTNIDFGLSEPDWVLEKVSFIDENNPVNAIEFEFGQIKQILQASERGSSDGLIKLICQ